MSQILPFSAGFWLLFFSAAALGGIVRFWLMNFLSRKLGMALPWGTLLVNCSGAMTLGLLAARVAEAEQAQLLWLVLGIGFLGAYTTVSSFSLQTLSLWQAGQWQRALLNVLLTVLLGLAAVTLGFYWGQA
ncbi:fluoride efflux transporter CrcB [Alkalimonas amylolytica]|uniref:Fluoride-specific ion channel FluC n=1 Tax=Alkalimonas amylolytica TaxID=152573 RepID=A0A1H3X7J5_ALKAM|nr:fluoride efflux transporter CrcB [Alkalimonas amylolytica]SDZ95385.1 camphor resistance protein CrcB [Alkalimonas amylolytica]